MGIQKRDNRKYSFPQISDNVVMIRINHNCFLRSRISVYEFYVQY